MKRYNLLLLTLLLTLVNGCNHLKYGPPTFEGCMILVTHIEGSHDLAECACVDNRVYSVNSFNDYLLPNIRARMVDHPEAQAVIDKLVENYKDIIKTHTYRLPIFACRGYFATSASDRTLLENWAEDNRVNRVKCEANLDDVWNY